MEELYKIMTGQPTWLLAQAFFLLGLGFFVLSWPKLYATFPNFFQTSGHRGLLTGSERLIVPYGGLWMCVSGFHSASSAAARFTGSHFLAAWSETLAVLSAIILLVGLPICLIAVMALRRRLANLSPEQDAAFERKSSQVAVYVLGGIVLLTIAINSIRASTSIPTICTGG
jgi:hypothetical protein